MVKEWAGIVKVTGSVGVIGLLVSLFMKYFFNEHIISVLGSDRTFYIIVALLCFFFICLLVAILKRSEPQPSNSQTSEKTESIKKDIRVTYQDNATHDGDNHF